VIDNAHSSSIQDVFTDSIITVSVSSDQTINIYRNIYNDNNDGNNNKVVVELKTLLMGQVVSVTDVASLDVKLLSETEEEKDDDDVNNNNNNKEKTKRKKRVYSIGVCGCGVVVSNFVMYL